MAIYLLADGQKNGHDYVDLGLPSGTKWATANIGIVVRDSSRKLTDLQIICKYVSFLFDLRNITSNRI